MSNANNYRQQAEEAAARVEWCEKKLLFERRGHLSNQRGLHSAARFNPPDKCKHELDPFFIGISSFFARIADLMEKTEKEIWIASPEPRHKDSRIAEKRDLSSVSDLAHSQLHCLIDGFGSRRIAANF